MSSSACPLWATKALDAILSNTISKQKSTNSHKAAAFKINTDILYVQKEITSFVLVSPLTYVVLATTKAQNRICTEFVVSATYSAQNEC